jgi:hypothetical protein
LWSRQARVGGVGGQRRFTWFRLVDLAGPVGLLAFVLAVASLHGLRSDLDPVRHTISEYSLGSYGWIMHAGFAALGVGVLATAWSLAQRQMASRRWKAGLVLLVAMGIGLFLDAGFNTDHLRVAETAHGTVHGTGTLVAVLSLPFSALVFGSALKQSAQSPVRAPWVQALALAQLLAIIGYETSPIAYRGLVERVVMVLAIATLALLQSLALVDPQRTDADRAVPGHEPMAMH